MIEKYFSNYQVYLEEIDSSNKSDYESCEYYLSRDSLNKWSKKEPQKCEKLAHNIII